MVIERGSLAPWARNSPSRLGPASSQVSRLMRDEQKGQAVAEQIQQGLTRWSHQLLKQQQGLAQGVSHHPEA